jgi:Flp pilus assembly protein CpaB
MGDGTSAALGQSPGRRVLDRPALPSARAVVGALLVTLSSVITFVAWQRASAGADRSYLVARRPVVPGERLGPGDLRSLPLELPAGLAASAFRDVDGLVGRVALAPIGEGELIQASQVSQEGSAPPMVMVAFALPRDRAVDGRLRSGDLVDVFVTYPDQTTAVATGVPVVALGESGGGLTGGGDLTVTLALDARQPRAELIHAVRAGEVTLVRSTGAGPPEGGAPAPGPPGAGPPGPQPGDTYRPGGAPVADAA